MLSIAVPCFNEADGIENLKRVLSSTAESLGSEIEILAVNDGSTDTTQAQLQQWANEEPRLSVLSHEKNKGLGAALRTALAEARGEWLVFLDADLTFHPDLIADLLKERDRQEADCVSGSPLLDGMAEVPLVRKMPSLLLNAFYRGLLSRRLTSFTPMFRLYRTTDLQALELRSNGFEISVEILAGLLKAGKKIVEIPASLTTRITGESKLRRWRELANHGRLVLRLLSGR
jgi:dolichol-phosphate mannosyltransferase